jgi:hypothetical protein
MRQFQILMVDASTDRILPQSLPRSDGLFPDAFARRIGRPAADF